VVVAKALFVGSVVALALAAPSALAADLSLPVKPMSAPPPPPVANWTGCYVNGGGGYGMWNQDSYFETFPAPFVPLAANATNGGRGWFGVVGGGCDYQLSVFGAGLVIGAFGDADFMHLHGDFSPSSSTVVGDENERWAWAAGARIGYLVTPTVLTYFNGGYTQTRFDQINFSFSAAPATPSPFVIPGHNYRGWFIGGGMEFALTVLPIPGFFWRNEYRYSSYQSADLEILATPPVPPTGLAQHMRNQVQTLATELVYKLNWTP
jgi:outer membrane immunogenic protein